MNNLQKIHGAVGIASFLVWMGILIASRYATDATGFMATFSDILMLAKTTTIGAVSIATAVSNFSPATPTIPAQPAGSLLPTIKE